MVVPRMCHCGRSVVVQLIQQMTTSSWAAWLTTNLKQGICCVLLLLYYFRAGIFGHRFVPLNFAEFSLSVIVVFNKQPALQTVLFWVWSTCMHHRSACHQLVSNSSNFWQVRIKLARRFSDNVTDNIGLWGDRRCQIDYLLIGYLFILFISC